jgi:hypothetical protein
MIRHYCDNCKKEAKTFKGLFHEPNFLPEINFDLCAGCLIKLCETFGKEEEAKLYVKLLDPNDLRFKTP